MIENQYSTADAASEARGADDNFATPSTDLQTRPAFNFDGNQGSEATSQSNTSALKDRALGRLRDEANNRKGVVSEQLKQVSSALGGIGGNTGDGQGGNTPAWLSNSVGQVTGLIDKLADNVENRDTAELVDDVKNFARANPAVFLGACALAGFVAVRIFAAAGDGR